MNVFFCLAIILGILMIIIGGTKGVRSFLSLFLNFAVMILIVLFMTDPNANPIILTLIGCTVISCINLFFINEVNSKTTTAFISTVISIVILLIFIAIIAEKAMIQGFSEEEMEEMGMFSLYISVWILSK